MNTIKEQIKAPIILFAFGISLYMIIFMWQFWRYGTSVLGINMMIAGLLIIAYYFFTNPKNRKKESLLWAIPLSLLFISIGIYSNPFVKTIIIIVMPLLFLIFTTWQSHENVRHSLLSKMFIPEFILSFMYWIKDIFTVPSRLHILSLTKGGILSAQAKQIAIGTTIFMIIAVIIIIPLLSSADQQFGLLFEALIDKLIALLSLEWYLKLFFFAAVGLALLGLEIYWKKSRSPFIQESQDTNKVYEYSTMFGTVLVGTLALYLLFLGIQINNLLISTLPNDFKITETLVKNGFWQLFVLTVMNAFFYIFSYGKTTKTVHRILGIFTLASLFLLFSAAQRVYLYVVTYGLSYEKFFALYTVIFCIGVFLWFLFLFTTKHYTPKIFQTLAFSALWLLAFSAILPLEKIILETNLNLTQREESRINLLELRMLSHDALPTVEKNFEKILVESIKDRNQSNSGNSDRSYMKDIDPVEAWIGWHKSQTKKSKQYHGFMSHIAKEVMKEKHGEEYANRMFKKKWYEKSLNTLFYKSTFNPDDYTKYIES